MSADVKLSLSLVMASVAFYDILILKVYLSVGMSVVQ